MTNKKTVHVLLFTLFISILLLNVPSAFSQINKKSVLWKISGNGLKQPSYLFGTVHILDSSNYFLHKTVIEKITKCNKMVFEVNTNEPDYQKKALQFSFMSNDSLENIFTKEEYQNLEQFFKKEFNFPLSAVHKMKPFYLSSVINALSMSKNAMSYEAELKKIATENGLGISGISTLEKENEIIEKMDMEVQKYTLYQAIEEHKTGYKHREQIVLLYKKKDIQGIYELMKRENSKEDSIVYDIMFPKRHEVWIPNIIKLMYEYSCFFAVGVGHLPGEYGLLSILIKEGYKVKPVNMDFKFHD
ncbi:MAG: TraB/GumN family protein [Bacteroidota bacterium]|nr:TraB/GumN family protein [Bacteroidota bacterium]